MEKLLFVYGDINAIAAYVIPWPYVVNLKHLLVVADCKESLIPSSAYVLASQIPNALSATPALTSFDLTY